jgi:hypothetical protein
MTESMRAEKLTRQSLREGENVIIYRFWAESREAFLLPLALLTCLMASDVYGAGFESDNPTVDAMVNRGIAYLEKNQKTSTHYPFTGISAAGFGEHALMAYAHMKVKHDPSHPLVQQGIKAALSVVGMLNQRDPGGTTSKSIYNASVAALLLAEVDRMKYRKELKLLADFLAQRQHRNGAFVYFGDNQGDTSQTQYAILALWTIDKAGLIIDYPRVPRIVDWLLRVQDPSGGWPYLGEDPGSSGKRVKQKDVYPSMGLAGGSTMLIAGDILRLWGDATSANDPKIFGLPTAAKLLLEGDENANYPRPTMAKEPLLNAIADCDKWLNSHSPNPGKLKSEFPYYQLYTLERYESFKEIAQKKKPDPEPGWFKEGVAYLKAQEEPGGGWKKDTYHLMQGTTSTSFAILFLIRSTKKAIEQNQEGMLAGGQGLPGDTTKIVVDGTQIKGEPVAEAVTDLLDMLEGEDPSALEGKSLPEDMKLDTDPKARQAQLDRLERLVRGSSSWQARRVAARLLGQSDEIRVVPALIFALDDPDTTVRTFARDGLRFISRKFEGFGMEIKRGEKQDYGELRRVQRLWREWYLTMDPGYIFVAE